MRFVIFSLLLLFLHAPAYAQDFVIIVNPEGPLVDADAQVVRHIYLGEKRFIAGVKLEPVNMSNFTLQENFLIRIVGMDSKEYRLHWIKKVFQEGLSFPPSFAAASEIVRFVRERKGAIAYIPKEESGITGVKVIGPP